MFSSPQLVHDAWLLERANAQAPRGKSAYHRHQPRQASVYGRFCLQAQPLRSGHVNDMAFGLWLQEARIVTPKSLHKTVAVEAYFKPWGLTLSRW